MKKTITVNLNGRVFTMDEDAYQLLDNYLKNLKIHFRKEEGSAEIIADFEARIEELLSEKLRAGRQEVINIKDIESVISLMGNPSDFSTDESGEENARKNDFPSSDESTKRRFFRNPEDKMLGGVCSGIAAYFGWEVLPVRIIFILLFIISYFTWAVVYMILWLILPLAQTAEDKLQMRGKPITVENIGKTVSAAAEKEEVKKKGRGCLSTLVEFFVGFIKLCLFAIALIVGIPLIVAGIVAVVALFLSLVGIGSGLIFFDWFNADALSGYPLVASISLIFLILIPIVCIIYSVIAYLAKFKPLNRGVKWGLFIAWVVAFVLFFASGARFASWIGFNSQSIHKIIVDDHRPVDKLVTLPQIKSVSLKGKLAANLQLEQSEGNESCLMIYADRDVIDKIDYYVRGDGELILSTKSKRRLKSREGIVLRLQTPDINEVEIDGFGIVNVVGSFRSDNLYFELDGSGAINADSLFVDNLTARMRGAGDITFAGKAGRSNLSVDGAGNIDAFGLPSDTVCAAINGVGDIRCDPSQYLNATVKGAGEIRYKEEPRTRDSWVFGVGSVSRD